MNLDPAASDTYWCARDAEDFAKEYFSKVALGGPAYLARLQLLARQHFYGSLPVDYMGDMPSSAQVLRSGKQGQNVDVRVNWLRAHVNAKHQIVVAPKLAWGATGTNTDARSLADASRAASILEYMWKSGPFEQLSISAALGAIIDGEEFLFNLFDGQGGKEVSFDKESGHIEYEGEIACVSIPSWDVFRDWTARSYEESPWRSVRRNVNRFGLVARYPQMKEQILAAPAATFVSVSRDGGFAQSIDDSKVTAHYFFHDKRPELPLGLQSVMLSQDCVLEFDALEQCYQTSPVIRFVASELKGTPWPYSSMWEAMGPQNLSTDIQSSLATNIVTFGRQMISAESDSNLPIDQIGNGPTVIYRPKGSAMPEALQLTASSPESFKHLDRLKEDQRLILGLNDMAMGEPPQGPPNAQAWALLATANITNNSGEQRNFVASVRAVGRSILAIVKAKYSAKRKALIVGTFGASVPMQEEYDQTNFQGIEDVTVDIDNPLMQTSAGRLQIAQMYQESGFIQVPEQVEQLVATGKLEPMTQTLRNELNYIAWENEQILKGINPPVMISDSHQMHAREHKVVMFSPDGRNNREAITAYNAHQRSHTQFEMATDPRILAMFGQAAPAPGAPPAGAPPGGASAPDVTKAPGKDSPAAVMAQPGAEPQGAAASIKQPTAAVNPATGSPAGPPGMPQ